MNKIILPIIILLCSTSHIAYSQDVSSDVTQPNNDDCNNGEISIIINSGMEPINYMWSNGANSKTLENLENGEYSVLITDALCREVLLDFELECDCSFDIFISDFKSPSNSTNYPECENSFNGPFDDGSITIGTNPPDGNYTYNWSNGSTSNMISNLVKGSYSVTVTKGSCTRVKHTTLWACKNLVPVGFGDLCEPDSGNDGNWDGTIEVDLNGPPIPVSDDSPCSGSLDVNVALIGVVGTYTTHWQKDNEYFSQETDIDNLCVGEYCFFVNDGCNEPEEYCFDIVNCDDNSISINGDLTNTCKNVAFGSIELDISGGVAPFSYNWSNGGIEKNVGLLPSGTHSVTVTDFVGCQASETFEIQDNIEFVEEHKGNCVFISKCNGDVVPEKERTGDIDVDFDEASCSITKTCVDDFFASGSDIILDGSLPTYAATAETFTDGCPDLVLMCVGPDELIGTEDDVVLFDMPATAIRSEIENTETPSASCASCYSATVCDYDEWNALTNGVAGTFNSVVNIMDEFVVFPPNLGYSNCPVDKFECEISFGCAFVPNSNSNIEPIPIWFECVETEQCNEGADLPDIEDYFNICDKPTDEAFFDAAKFSHIDTSSQIRNDNTSNKEDVNVLRESPIKNSTVLVFPNPTASILNVKLLYSNEITIDKFIIVDLQGNEITLESNQTSPIEISVDMSSIKTGIYIGYFYCSSGQVFTRKIVKI